MEKQKSGVISVVLSFVGCKAQPDRNEMIFGCVNSTFRYSMLL